MIMHAFSYENPWLSAAERGTIVNIQMLIRELSALDCLYPRLFTSLLFRGNSGDKQRPLLFRALRIWTEVLEIYDNESFGMQPVIQPRYQVRLIR
jgi:hypothetical protein